MLLVWWSAQLMTVWIDFTSDWSAAEFAIICSQAKKQLM